MASRKSGGDDWMLYAAILIALLIFGGLGGNKPGPTEPAPTTAPTVQATVAPTDVTAATKSLSGLSVVADGTTAGGYTRDSFGPAWKDVDRNGCDTRNDILARDLKNPVFQTGSRCVVVSGVLDPEPYTGSKLVWKKGDQPGIDIDHMVPLKRAWDMGASKWAPQQREEYANDPAILLATSGSANRAKSDQGPGTWMPSANKCSYAVHYVSVSAKYKLSITTADKRVLESTLKGC